jgi:hypothetical protein
MAAWDGIKGAWPELASEWRAAGEPRRLKQKKAAP